MDLNTITDIDKLKSLAFDQIQLIEQSQQNLRVIQARLARLLEKSEETDATRT